MGREGGGGRRVRHLSLHQKPRLEFVAEILSPQILHKEWLYFTHLGGTLFLLEDSFTVGDPASGSQTGCWLDWLFHHCANCCVPMRDFGQGCPGDGERQGVAVQPSLLLG